MGTNALVSVKVIRNKTTQMSEGYGFVEFASHEAAEHVLRTLNGQLIPNTDQIFRLNWAAFGVGKTADGTLVLAIDPLHEAPWPWEVGWDGTW